MMFLALLRKEWRLQQQTLQVILYICGLWLLGFFYGFAPRQPDTVIDPARVAMAAHIICVVILMLLVPLLAGTTVAIYERKDGILDWQLSLPVPRAKQWAAKLLTALAITLISAAVLSTLLTAILAASRGGRYDTYFEGLMLRGYWAGVFAILIMAAGVFASASGFDPYRSLLFGMLLFIATLAGHAFFKNDENILSPIYTGYGRRWVSLPWLHTARWLFLAAILCIIGYFNFRPPGIRFRRALAQLIAFFALVVLSAYIVLYYESPRKSREFYLASMPAQSSLQIHMPANRE